MKHPSSGIPAMHSLKSSISQDKPMQKPLKTDVLLSHFY